MFSKMVFHGAAFAKLQKQVFCAIDNMAHNTTKGNGTVYTTAWWYEIQQRTTGGVISFHIFNDGIVVLQAKSGKTLFKVHVNIERRLAMVIMYGNGALLKCNSVNAVATLYNKLFGNNELKGYMV